MWYICSVHIWNRMVHANYMKSWASYEVICLEMSWKCMTLKLLINCVHFPLFNTQYVACLSKLVQTVFPGVLLQTPSSPNSMHCLCNFWISNSYTWRPSIIHKRSCPGVQQKTGACTLARFMFPFFCVWRKVTVAMNRTFAASKKPGTGKPR